MQNQIKVIIMAGGKGTRISSIQSDVPKPMLKLCGKPILEHEIEVLKEQNLTEITLVIGHLGNIIKDYFKDGKDFGVNINYFEETEALGTGGALFKIPNLLEEDNNILLLNADIIFDIDFSRLISFHKSNNAAVTLTSHPNSHPYDSAILITEILPPQEKGGLPIETNRVINWLTKEDNRVWYKNKVNAGIQIINTKFLRMIKNHITKEKLDLDRDILKPFLKDAKIFTYNTTEYIKDAGTPDRFYSTEKDIKSEFVKKRNLKNKQKAVFLDRDGTINKDAGFITNIENLELLPNVASAIKKINESGFLALLVTNQPVIARGDVTFEELQNIHNKLETLLGKEGAYLDAIYFCPHHTDIGFDGERLEYKCNCDCRKPKPGMLFNAAKDFNIDLKESYMVGDSRRDIEAGKNAGCKMSVLVNEQYTLLDFVNEYIVK